MNHVLNWSWRGKIRRSVISGRITSECLELTAEFRHRPSFKEIRWVNESL